MTASDCEVSLSPFMPGDCKIYEARFREQRQKETDYWQLLIGTKVEISDDELTLVRKTAHQFTAFQNNFLGRMPCSGGFIEDKIRFCINCLTIFLEPYEFSFGSVARYCDKCDADMCWNCWRPISVHSGPEYLCSCCQKEQQEMMLFNKLKKEVEQQVIRRHKEFCRLIKKQERLRKEWKKWIPIEKLLKQARTLVRERNEHEED